MSGQDLFDDLRNNTTLLHASLTEFGKRGKAYADAEKTYRVALAKQILIERDNKVPVTIISDICRGNPEIARLRFQKDVAEVSYKAAMEAIQVYKLNIRVLESAIEREWGNAK